MRERVVYVETPQPVLPHRGLRRAAFWPFRVLWRGVTLIANLLGILLTLLIGFLLMVVGFALTSTVIGAILGIPLLIIGFLFVLRGLW